MKADPLMDEARAPERGRSIAWVHSMTQGVSSGIVADNIFGLFWINIIIETVHEIYQIQSETIN